MTASNGNSPELLREEILTEARQQCDGILRQARQEAGTILSAAEADADRLRRERLDHARAEAARRAELTLATVTVEAHLLRLARVESVLQSLCDQARQQLLARSDFDYGEALLALAREAVDRMVGDAFVLRLPPADRSEFGPALVTALARQYVGRSLAFRVDEDPALADGGVEVQDPEARQVWDNGLGARLDRLWPELKWQIAVQTGLVLSDHSKGGGA